MKHLTLSDTPQYIEDLATAYWYSEALFTAVELDIFTLLYPNGKPAEEIAELLNCDCAGIKRFLDVLCVLGLVAYNNNIFHNTEISSRYLVQGQPDYQGHSVLWRQALVPRWQELKECLKKGGRITYPGSDEDPAQKALRFKHYIQAMDCVAKTKVQEILRLMPDMEFQGRLLDVGAGSGAISAGFLRQFPQLTATLLDLPEVLDLCQHVLSTEGLGDRASLIPADILQSWPVEQHFDLVILSNIIHIYGEDEVRHLLSEAKKYLHQDGLLIIHDFMTGHYPAKAALFDLNMFINTFNGQVFSPGWLATELKNQGFAKIQQVPLNSDTMLIISTKR